MFQRVRDFGNTYRAVLTASAAAQELLTAIGDAIDELTTADVTKLSAAKAARGERKAAARAALLDLLRKGNQLARALRAEGYAVPECDLPASQNDQSLLTAGRHLAAEAERFATQFDGHGMPAAAVARATAAFERAAGDRGAGRADHVAISARIRGVLTATLVRARRLDVVVGLLMANDESALAVWKQARRVQEPRGGRISSNGATATSGGDSAVLDSSLPGGEVPAST
jgi:hypothetical protein